LKLKPFNIKDMEILLVVKVLRQLEPAAARDKDVLDVMCSDLFFVEWWSI